MTNKIDIYGRAGCPWCDKAKAFASENNLPFDYRDFTDAPKILDELEARAEKAGFRVLTVPQIFVGETAIGGYEAFLKAHADGRVAQLLGE
jgi:glutaredoxin